MRTSFGISEMSGKGYSLTIRAAILNDEWTTSPIKKETTVEVSDTQRP